VGKPVEVIRDRDSVAVVVKAEPFDGTLAAIKEESKSTPPRLLSQMEPPANRKLTESRKSASHAGIVTGTSTVVENKPPELLGKDVAALTALPIIAEVATPEGCDVKSTVTDVVSVNAFLAPVTVAVDKPLITDSKDRVDSRLGESGRALKPMKPLSVTKEITDSWMLQCVEAECEARGGPGAEVSGAHTVEGVKEDKTDGRVGLVQRGDFTRADHQSHPALEVESRRLLQGERPARKLVVVEDRRHRDDEKVIKASVSNQEDCVHRATISNIGNTNASIQSSRKRPRPAAESEDGGEFAESRDISWGQDQALDEGNRSDINAKVDKDRSTNGDVDNDRKGGVKRKKGSRMKCIELDLDILPGAQADPRDGTGEDRLLTRTSKATLAAPDSDLISTSSRNTVTEYMSSKRKNTTVVTGTREVPPGRGQGGSHCDDGFSLSGVSGEREDRAATSVPVPSATFPPAAPQSHAQEGWITPRPGARGRGALHSSGLAGYISTVTASPCSGQLLNRADLDLVTAPTSNADGSQDGRQSMAVLPLTPAETVERRIPLRAIVDPSSMRNVEMRTISPNPRGAVMSGRDVRTFRKNPIRTASTDLIVSANDPLAMIRVLPKESEREVQVQQTTSNIARQQKKCYLP